VATRGHSWPLVDEAVDWRVKVSRFPFVRTVQTERSESIHEEIGSDVDLEQFGCLAPSRRRRRRRKRRWVVGELSHYAMAKPVKSDVPYSAKSVSIASSMSSFANDQKTLSGICPAAAASSSTSFDFEAR